VDSLLHCLASGNIRRTASDRGAEELVRHAVHHPQELCGPDYRAGLRKIKGYLAKQAYSMALFGW
jgi:hypothetical protein